MKHTKRILCGVLSMVLLLTVALTGCSMPKLYLGGTPAVAGTIGDREVSTGEYLAYLYNNFYQIYYSQGLYYYESYGMDPWTQEFTYGEGDDAQKVKLSEYLTLMTKDAIVRQDALAAMLKANELSWITDEEKKLDEEMKDMAADAYLPLGFSNENFIKSYKALSLNERSLFFGLYGKGGKREVTATELKKYFDDNYLSYKMISINLTDDKGKELKDDAKKKILDQLNGYLTTYNKDKNFEAVVDAYNKANAGKDEKVEPSKDADNRVDVDSSNMDEDLRDAIRKLDVGTAKVVEYKADGTTPTAALILRLDIHSPEKLFTDSTEDIIYSLKYEAFDEEVEKEIKKITATFNKKVLKKCKAEKFLEATK